MNDSEEKQLLFIIKSLLYGEIVIKKESGKIVHIKRSESIKLSGVSRDEEKQNGSRS